MRDTIGLFAGAATSTRQPLSSRAMWLHPRVSQAEIHDYGDSSMRHGGHRGCASTEGLRMMLRGAIQARTTPRCSCQDLTCLFLER
ncbi:unnamed protein product [Alternaria burnsii]|nr:unnamed protein product [Alternaria burnsii]